MVLVGTRSEETAMTLSDELRQAIVDSGLTLYRVAKDSGVSYGVMYRFAADERDITLTTAGKIADALGLHLAKLPKRATSKGGKKR